MLAALRYGTGFSVHLELADQAVLAECGTPRALPLEDPQAALAEALAEPLEYPPLARSTTPGDRVVLAMDSSLPQSGRMAAGVIRALVAAGVHADGITVLRTEADAEAAGADPRPWLSEEIAGRITLGTHHPADRRELSYLAANQEGEPIVLSRALVDADVVIPVGCFHSRTTVGYHGVHSAIYPNFSDQPTLTRFLAIESRRPWGPRNRRLVREANLVGWLLGVTFTVQVIPGPGDRPLHLLAGDVRAVRRRGRQRYDEAWHSHVPAPASLVVAAIEGDATQQTWASVGRALDAALPLVEEGGALALCCGLSAAPGPAVGCLAAAHSRPAALRQIRRDRPHDALPAMQLARALDRAHLYLLSGLDRGLVEDLDIAPLEHGEELARLARQHSSCILLSNAVHAAVTVAREP